MALPKESRDSTEQPDTTEPTTLQSRVSPQIEMRIYLNLDLHKTEKFDTSRDIYVDIEYEDKDIKLEDLMIDIKPKFRRKGKKIGDRIKDKSYHIEFYSYHQNMHIENDDDLFAQIENIYPEDLDYEEGGNTTNIDEIVELRMIFRKSKDTLVKEKKNDDIERNKKEKTKDVPTTTSSVSQQPKKANTKTDSVTPKPITSSLSGKTKNAVDKNQYISDYEMALRLQKEFDALDNNQETDIKPITTPQHTEGSHAGLTGDEVLKDEDVEKTMDEVLHKMEMLLYKLCNVLKSKDEFINCMRCLHKVVNNLVIHPLDKPDDKNKNPSKYRKLNLNNEKLKKNVFNYQPALDLLLLIGFVQQSDNINNAYLVMPECNENPLVFAALTAKITNCQPPNSKIPLVKEKKNRYMKKDVPSQQPQPPHFKIDSVTKKPIIASLSANDNDTIENDQNISDYEMELKMDIEPINASQHTQHTQEGDTEVTGDEISNNDEETETMVNKLHSLFDDVDREIIKIILMEECLGNMEAANNMLTQMSHDNMSNVTIQSPEAKVVDEDENNQRIKPPTQEKVDIGLVVNNLHSVFNTFEKDDGMDQLRGIPEEFIDPITKKIMTDPTMIVSSMKVYDVFTIQKWLLSNRRYDPITGIPMSLGGWPLLLQRRYDIREKVKKFIRENPSCKSQVIDNCHIEYEPIFKISDMKMDDVSKQIVQDQYGLSVKAKQLLKSVQLTAAESKHNDEEEFGIEYEDSIILDPNIPIVCMMGPSRNGKSTLVNDILGVNEACKTSLKANVALTKGAWITRYSKKSKNYDFYLVDMEGLSHNVTTFTKRLFYACYAMSNVVIWNDKNVASDEFKQLMKELKDEMNDVATSDKKPSFLYLKRDAGDYNYHPFKTLDGYIKYEESFEWFRDMDIFTSLSGYELNRPIQSANDEQGELNFHSKPENKALLKPLIKTISNLCKTSKRFAYNSIVLKKQIKHINESTGLSMTEKLIIDNEILRLFLIAPKGDEYRKRDMIYVACEFNWNHRRMGNKFIDEMKKLKITLSSLNQTDQQLLDLLEENKTEIYERVQNKVSLDPVTKWLKATVATSLLGLGAFCASAAPATAGASMVIYGIGVAFYAAAYYSYKTAVRKQAELVATSIYGYAPAAEWSKDRDTSAFADDNYMMYQLGQTEQEKT